MWPGLWIGAAEARAAGVQYRVCAVGAPRQVAIVPALPAADTCGAERRAGRLRCGEGTGRHTGA